MNRRWPIIPLREQAKIREEYADFMRQFSTEELESIVSGCASALTIQKLKALKFGRVIRRFRAVMTEAERLEDARILKDLEEEQRQGKIKPQYI